MLMGRAVVDGGQPKIGQQLCFYQLRHIIGLDLLAVFVNAVTGQLTAFVKGVGVLLFAVAEEGFGVTALAVVGIGDSLHLTAGLIPDCIGEMTVFSVGVGVAIDLLTLKAPYTGKLPVLLVIGVGFGEVFSEETLKVGFVQQVVLTVIVIGGKLLIEKGYLFPQGIRAFLIGVVWACSIVCQQLVQRFKFRIQSVGLGIAEDLIQIVAVGNGEAVCGDNGKCSVLPEGIVNAVVKFIPADGGIDGAGFPLVDALEFQRKLVLDQLTVFIHIDHDGIFVPRIALHVASVGEQHTAVANVIVPDVQQDHSLMVIDHRPQVAVNASVFIGFFGHRHGNAVGGYAQNIGTAQLQHHRCAKTVQLDLKTLILIFFRQQLTDALQVGLLQIKLQRGVFRRLRDRRCGLCFGRRI